MGSIAPKLTYLKQTKEAIKAAIENKGVTVDTERFRDYASLILSISTSDSAAPTVTVSADGNVKATSSGGTKTVKLSSSHDSDFKAENIKSGVNIFGVNGTYAPTFTTETVTSSAVWSGSSQKLTMSTSKNISGICNFSVTISGSGMNALIIYDSSNKNASVVYPANSEMITAATGSVSYSGKNITITFSNSTIGHIAVCNQVVKATITYI